jgi:ABC-type nitrate/sulfonate/bicarbonate transport system permease component
MGFYAPATIVEDANPLTKVTFQTDKVFVGVLIFAISGIILTEIINRIEHRYDKWRPQVGAAE